MSSLFLLASTQFITSAASTTSDALSPASLASSAGISSPQGGTYLVPNLVTSGNVPFTFMENFKPLITDDCQETCMPFTNTITQCNATATSDAGLSSCLCASINPVLDCSKCVAEGTLPGATRGSNSSIQAAAAVVVYVDLFNACMQLGLLKPTATEVSITGVVNTAPFLTTSTLQTVTILATPQVPPKLFANKSSIQEAHAAAITSNCCRACTRNSSASKFDVRKT